jgi:5-methyltetrahydrofolate corrinoid/iron sulfur protein methyltransferase
MGLIEIKLIVPGIVVDGAFGQASYDFRHLSFSYPPWHLVTTTFYSLSVIHFPRENMIIISERINGQFGTVGRAIDRRDEKFIQDLARQQESAGADYLDINTGPGREDGPACMDWLVRTVQDAVDLPLCLDSPGPKTMEAGLKACDASPLINSTTAEAKKMERFFPLAKEYDSDIVCLTINEKGIPNDAASRTELAMMLITTAMENEVMPDKLFIDPVILPVGAAQDQGKMVIESVRQFRMLNDPPVRTVVGLSNVSNMAKERSLLNRSFLAMLMGAGLTAAIADPEDRELMKIVKAGEILLNESLYCDDFLMHLRE